MTIPLKDEQSIKHIAIAGNIIHEIFKTIHSRDLSGMTTSTLDKDIDTMIRDRGGIPTFLQYRGFPKSCCISLNHEVVHGIPDNRVIQPGDLVKIDIGVTYNGLIADAATTIPIGTIPDDVQRLLTTTKNALKNGITQAQHGKRISDISRAIQTTIEEQGFSVVRELTGHGVGSTLHEEPVIPNFIGSKTDPEITEGMVLAIEPMVNMGEYHVATAANGWTIVSRDGSLSAHYEDTIAILKRGNMNCTRVIEG